MSVGACRVKATTQPYVRPPRQREEDHPGRGGCASALRAFCLAVCLRPRRGEWRTRELFTGVRLGHTLGQRRHMQQISIGGRGASIFVRDRDQHILYCKTLGKHTVHIYHMHGTPQIPPNPTTTTESTFLTISRTGDPLHPSFPQISLRPDRAHDCAPWEANEP
jgi:hypothetical protein